VLELAILGLLKEQDLHGYELKKRLGEMLGVASGVSFGSLYPALGRLERSGAVRTVEPTDGKAASPARPAIPMTGSLGGELAAWRARSSPTAATGPKAGAGRAGRSRKVYGITDHGDALFEDLLAAEQSNGDDSRLFHLRLAFAGYLSVEARLGMLERRRAHLLDRLTRAGTGSRAGRRIDGYVRSLMEHDRESTEHDLTWIERLIARDRDPAARAAGERTTPPTVPASAASTPAPAPVTVSTAPAVPPAIAPPTLSGLRADIAVTGPRARPYQEESIR
jgi:DNA-binding PadR family transcriptional regulator